jgi:hypothetical protein
MVEEWKPEKLKIEMMTNIRYQKEQTAGKYIRATAKLVGKLRGNGEKFYKGARGKRITFRLGRW